MTNLLKHRLQLLRGFFREKKLFNWPLAGKRLGSGFVLQPIDRRWIARRGPALLGWPGVTGIGLLVACAAFYLSTVQSAQEKLASTRLNVLALQDQFKRGGGEQKANQRTPEEQLARFYQLFPRDKDLPVWLEKIFDSAEKQGIGLDQGEYKVTRDKEGGLVRFQMTFPVKGEYPRIRKYLSSLMTDIPTLSLQQVQFKRQKVGDAIVEAHIKLVLYLLEQGS